MNGYGVMSRRQHPISKCILDSPVLVLSATITSSIRKDIDRVLGLQPAETSVIAVVPNR
jgi:superfamily II DNA helicase RecQ